MNPTRTRLPRALLVLLPALALACSPPPPPPRPKPAPAPAPKVLEEEVPKSPASIYVYSPVGKRDPFQNVFAVKEVKPTITPGGGRKPTPLQRFPLDRLKLSMTMTGTASPMAMLEDPDGRGWTVRVGDFVGQNWGKVTSIQRDQIIVTETITDHATGRVYPQNIPLKVPKDATETASEKALKDGETLGAVGQQ